MSGQLRTGVHAIPALRRFVDDMWDGVDWFIHTWDWSRQKPSNWAERYRTRVTTPEMMATMAEAYRPRAWRVDPHDATLVSLGLSTVHATSQWAGIHICERMRQEWCQAHGAEHGVVIRLRPDVVYARDNRLRRWVDHCLAGPENMLWSAVADARRIDDVIWAARPGTMSWAAEYWRRLVGCDEPLRHDLWFIEHLAERGITGASPPFAPSQIGYAPLREESWWLDPEHDFRRIYAMDLMLYSTHQVDWDTGATVPTHEWLAAGYPRMAGD